MALVTITAPGSDHFPLDANGELHGWPVFLWNKSAPERWRKLNAAARARTRRAVGACPPLAARTVEYQRRGLIHYHVAFPLRSLRDRHALDVYVKALCDLRWRHGFGFVDRGQYDPEKGKRVPMVMEAAKAAWYLAKYLAPTDKQGKMSLTETVQHRDVPRLVVHVSRNLTSSTGVTMRNLRLKRRFFRAVTRNPELAALWPLIESQWDYAKLLEETAGQESAPNAPPLVPAV